MEGKGKGISHSETADADSSSITNVQERCKATRSNKEVQIPREDGTDKVLGMTISLKDIDLKQNVNLTNPGTPMSPPNQKVYVRKHCNFRATSSQSYAGHRNVHKALKTPLDLNARIPLPPNDQSLSQTHAGHHNFGKALKMQVGPHSEKPLNHYSRKRKHPAHGGCSNPINQHQNFGSEPLLHLVQGSQYRDGSNLISQRNVGNPVKQHQNFVSGPLLHLLQGSQYGDGSKQINQQDVGNPASLCLSQDSQYDHGQNSNPLSQPPARSNVQKILCLMGADILVNQNIGGSLVPGMGAMPSDGNHERQPEGVRKAEAKIKGNERGKQAKADGYDNEGGESKVVGDENGVTAMPDSGEQEKES